MSLQATPPWGGACSVEEWGCVKCWAVSCWPGGKTGHPGSVLVVGGGGIPTME